MLINADLLVAYLNFGGLLSRDHLNTIFGTTNLELISILQHFKVNATTHNFDKIIDSVITNNMCWARTDSILKIVTILIKMGAKATEKSTNYLAKMGCSSEFRFVVEQGFPIGPACRALALAHGHDDIVRYIDGLKR